MNKATIIEETLRSISNEPQDIMEEDPEKAAYFLAGMSLSIRLLEDVIRFMDKNEPSPTMKEITKTVLRGAIKVIQKNSDKLVDEALAE